MAWGSHAPDVERTIAPFGRTAAHFKVEGPPAKLPPKLTLSLTMGLHELATNAAKYGALSTSAGAVRVAWEIIEDPDGALFKFQWKERSGPAVRPPQQRGFGTRLIERGLKREFGGEVRLLFEPEGVVCEIETRIQPDAPALVGGLVALHRRSDRPVR